MQNNLTELVFILDKSGSMTGLEEDTIGGYNSLIEKQKKEDGEALVTTVVFSNTSRFIHDRVDIQKVEKLTRNDYFPSGCTALLDAIGMTINHIKHIQDKMDKDSRPSKTLFVITTDGEENASREYNYKTINKLIEKVKERYGYEFLFVAANIDACDEAEKLGIGEENAEQYINDSEGIKRAYYNMECRVNSVRNKK